jgi:transposase-like protein
MRRPEGQADTHVGRLWDTTRRNAPLTGFHAQHGESQAEWEGLLQDLDRRGVEGKDLLLIVTDGRVNLAAAIQT